MGGAHPGQHAPELPQRQHIPRNLLAIARRAHLPQQIHVIARGGGSIVITSSIAGDADDASTMVQLAWPDPAGVLPWEDGFAAELAPLQVLIGDPPGPRAV